MNLSLKKITNEEFTRLGGLDLVRGKEHKIKFSTGEHLHEPIQHKFPQKMENNVGRAHLQVAAK